MADAIIENPAKELIVDPSSVKDIKEIVKQELKNLPEDKIGSVVEGNPEGEATEILTKLSIKNEGQETIFGISAGLKLYKHTFTATGSNNILEICMISLDGDPYTASSLKPALKNGRILSVVNNRYDDPEFLYLRDVLSSGGTLNFVWLNISRASLAVSVKSDTFTMGDDTVVEL